MRFFETRLSLSLLFICLPLLFLPKINLLTIESETAGVRIDDLILFFLSLLLLWSHTLSEQKLFKIEGWILLFIAFSFLSFLSNYLLVSLHLLPLEAKIFYAARFLEYFIFFYIGAMASHYFQVKKVILCFLLWNLALMTLQKLQWIGAITVLGYQSDVSARVYGIASFPSEMGLILNLLFCYFIYDDERSSFLQSLPSPLIRYLLRKSYPYVMFFLFAIFIIFTGNRISILALLISFLYRLKQDIHARSFGIALFALPLLIFGVVFLISQTASVYSRSLDLFSYNNLKLGLTIWEQIDITQPPVDPELVISESYDMSWWIRIHKWVYALKTYLSNPLWYLQGIGPGYTGAALDGGILRLLVEVGLMGGFIFWKFFQCLYRINPQLKWMCVAFLMNMIFFDAYLAYKTMSLFFFIAGNLFEKQRAPSLTKVQPSTMRSFLFSSNA